MEKTIIRVNYYTFGKNDLSVQEMRGYKYLEKITGLDNEETETTLSQIKNKYPESKLIIFKY